VNTDQGGGLFVESGSPLLHNTLIGGNFRGTGTTRDDVYGSLDPGGDYNLIGDGTGMTGLSNGVHGNLVGPHGNPIDPLLGPLQDNGGPTLMHALLSGSPAIDAGNNDYATDWDQRGDGFPRIVNEIIDIGAFEYQGDGSPSPSQGRFSLRTLAPLTLALPNEDPGTFQTIPVSTPRLLNLGPAQAIGEAPAESVGKPRAREMALAMARHAHDAVFEGWSDPFSSWGSPVPAPST
jgi:hypothetical protein